MTRLAPALTLALMLGPIGAGLLGTLLPAFGYLPALGGAGFGLAPIADLLALPGLGRSIALTLFTGIGATMLATLLVLALMASDGRMLRLARRLATPILAVPHAAVALGLAFLLAPSGWFARLVAFDAPPDWPLPGDPWGLALILGLALKETAFLLLAALAAEAQARPEPYLLTACALGQSAGSAWLKVALPLVYRRIRLPIYAVLGYSLSVVDMALVLAPSTPAPLAVELLRLFRDPQPERQFAAAAGALLLALLVAGAIASWALAARGVCHLGRRWAAAGGRGRGLDGLLRPLCAAGSLVLLLALLSLGAMGLWSFALGWRFPSLWPESFGLANWARQAPVLGWTGFVTLGAAVAATVPALALTLGCLENEVRRGRAAGDRSLWLLYLPLLVPQISFLFGMQAWLVWLGIDGSAVALVWAHLVFVLPYVFLALADPYRGFDERYARSARTLGARPARVFWRIKAPMLAPAILFAAAVGFAVSVAQYLPTLFAGGGRYATLTTEALALAGGNDRRVIGVYALSQAVLPLAAFLLAGLAGRRRA